jgi:hypothetical protein
MRGLVLSLPVVTYNVVKAWVTMYMEVGQMSMKDATQRYYEVWAAQDRVRINELLHGELVFTSLQDSFNSADSFLSACWRYSSGLVVIRFVKEVYEGDRAFVILRWLKEDGSTFVGAEYLESADEKIEKDRGRQQQPPVREADQIGAQS